MDNNESHRTAVISASLSDRDFLRLSRLIYSECAIKMPFQKKIMLEARLRKRLRELGMYSFREYCDYLFSEEGMGYELTPMIDVVTTNKTDFFREPRHFDFLARTALPELMKVHGAGTNRQISVWSAGCSTGEEPYTIAMVLNEFRIKHPAFHFFILATDISTKVLDRAIRGIYKEERAETIQRALKEKYFIRSRDRERGLVRIVPELRSQVRFRRLNFMDEDFGIREPMDIIFCRNVIIYFDRPTQEKLINRLCRHLIPGGYLFMGHSETLSGLNVPLVSAGPMVYRKPL
ncbi:MAG TPA: chemotaxis protein CheR [Nitrospiraceae bacterium]|nr:chemotaxis protein CheR [Nitrospiraceae bacterium]